MKTILLLLTASVGLTVAQAQTQLPSISTCTATPTANFYNLPSCFGYYYLRDSSVAAAGDPITAWHWSMPEGNPSSSTTQNDYTLYTTAGTYSIMLTVTSQSGCKDSIIKTATILSPPVANFSYSQNGNSVTFTDLSSTADGTIYYWYWDFPEGNPSSSNVQHPTTTYSTTGTHIVSLYVASNWGCKDTLYQPITVTSINEIYFANKIHISPNPLRSQTIIHSDVVLHNASLSIDNCFGEQVKQIENINGQTIVLDRNNLASGLYFLRLTEGNKIYREKLIVAD